MSLGWARSPQGRRLLRKSVPDGSCDFQKALDHFLSTSESEEDEQSDCPDGASSADDELGRDRKKKTKKNKYVVDTEKEEEASDDEGAETIDDYVDDFEDVERDEDSRVSSYAVEVETDNGQRLQVNDLDVVKSRASKKTKLKGDYNNNNRRLICTCGLYQNKGDLANNFSLEHQGAKNAWDSPNRDDCVSPVGAELDNQYFGCLGKRDSLPLKLPSITAHLCSSPPAYASSLPEIGELSNMGINCSTNLPDTREFSGVLTDQESHKHSNSKSFKLGDLLAKRRSHSETSGHFAHTSANSESFERAGSDHCSCTSRGDEKKPNTKIDPSKNVRSSQKTSMLSGHKNVTSRSSSLPGKCSSKTASSSPQRLLTSRNRSPNGYLRTSNSMEATGDMRARSHSWSNGRSISHVRPGPIKPITKNSSLFPRSAGASPTGHHHTLTAPQEAESIRVNSSPTNSSDTELVESSSDCLKAGMAHHPGCPLYVKPSDLSAHAHKKPTLCLNKLQAEKVRNAVSNTDIDLPPLQRPRASSESQTTRRPRQHNLLDLPRPRSHTVSDGEGDNSPSPDLAHGAHVHWADEEKGLSLSTSVLLTSIRPRSYSHGAVDGRPHRPILKKVAGL
ncbi:hypothetical protein PoB_002979400 [Plakobranchus ocellatus]|uniref:Uncharacterized protein n=1 Tax=Plakobranchus ocellatus TaxID=259542 RepID=A0AAV4A6F8_9GAST|nr:hypothetical protein PoB_002979400 [Plakobranchus ocellatus]